MLAILLNEGCSPSPTSKSLQTQTSPILEDSQRRPLTSFSEEITSPIHELTLQAGSTYALNITAKNAGNEPWHQQGTGEMPVNAGYRWVDDKGTILPFEGTRAYLSRAVVAPGDSDHMKLTIKGEPKPGTYNLWVSMVQEGVAWFYDKHAAPLVIRVTIT
jgi:hypothetical protein